MLGAVLKRLTCGLGTVCLCMSYLLWAGMASQAQASERTVSGVGYPPIKTLTKSQAILMARRAAILDAYAKVARYQYPDKFKEDESLQHISTFIRGMKVLHEDFLADGSIQVTVSYGTGSLSSSPTVQGKAERKKDPVQHQQAGVKTINRQQWLQVISPFVNIETNKNQEKKEQ